MAPSEPGCLRALSNRPPLPSGIKSPKLLCYLSPTFSLLERAGSGIRRFMSCGLDTSGFGSCLHHLLTMRSWGMISLFLVEFLIWKGGEKILLRILKFKEENAYNRPNETPTPNQQLMCSRYFGFVFNIDLHSD